MWCLPVSPVIAALAIEKPSLSPPAAFKHNFRFLNVNKIACSADAASSSSANVLLNQKRKRYRKEYPGESQGITEEMRFVAMRLRNIKGKYVDTTRLVVDSPKVDDSEEHGGATWEPSVQGFVKYLVDSKLVFSTVERIVDESDHVSYCYFRNSGLERSESLSKDLEWLRQQQEIAIPQPSNPGLNYVKYLEELAERSAPLFLSHFYNIYFSHIAGGQLIARKVSRKIFEGKELEFYRWESDVEELLRDVRQKLNTLSKHWSRDDKNRCLKEATKSFRYMGQIVRLIIL